MMKNEKAQNLLAKYEKFSQAFDDEALKSVLRKDIIKLYAIIEKPSSRDNYIMGLFFYEDYDEHTSKKIVSERIDKAICFFEKSIALDKNYYMSNYYLGHCYQDLEDYSKAIEYYSKVNKDKLKKEFPLWRFVLLFELLGFCYWKIGEKSIGMKYFKRTCLEYLLLQDYFDLFPIGNYIEDCLGKNNDLVIKMKAYEKIKSQE